MKKSILSILILLFGDVLTIAFSTIASVFFRNNIFSHFIKFNSISYLEYLTYPFIYTVTISLFFYFKLYKNRYDFWQETAFILKITLISFIIVFATLALGKNIEYYSRTTLIFTFIFSTIFIPIVRFFIKRFLFKIKIWQKKVKVIGEISSLELGLFNSTYTGYVLIDNGDYDVLFIPSNGISSEDLNRIIEKNVINNKEILFIPVLDKYDFTQSTIYNNFNSRVNLFSLENNLLNTRNKLFKYFIDYIITICTLPFWCLIFILIVIKLKLDEPNGKIFFMQERLGANGKIFYCYKFRTMVSDQSFMTEWLINNPKEKEYYDIYHKYMDDPRITKFGCFLRKTSLDELPQLFNVLKGQMSLVGARPYMVSERLKMGSSVEIILAAKPGITGLWQVSGRSNISFDERLRIDTWYVKNWSLWNDIVILLKTFSVVLKKDGAS